MAFTNELEETKEYGNLKVLTILTFIGSGYALIQSIWSYFTIDKSLAKMQEVMNNPDVFNKLPDVVKKMYSPEALDLIRKSIANKIPITILAVIAAVLCIYGAIQMRQLKMNGYYLYIIGCILPFIASYIFLGTAAFTGVMAWIFIGVTVLFIILYTAQRKYLIDK